MDTGIPKKVGRYSVDRLLGAGAMGLVFLGRDPDLDRPVAIKTVRDLGMEPEALALFLERFRNEARAAARLQHPSIVQVYDVGEDPEAGLFLVFEYVAGSTLKQVLRNRGPLEPARVAQLADQIADALETAHHHGIIHRDLKPDNLLVTPDGHTKLADFGVARVPDAALTREGQFLGTPCYAAPETLKAGSYSPKSDLFSFAAVLYEAATGVRAFPGNDAVGVAHAVIHDVPTTPSLVAPSAKIPPFMDEIIMRGLDKNPRERFSSAHEMAVAIRSGYEEMGVLDHDHREMVRPPTGRIRRPSLETKAAEAASGGAMAFGAVLLGGLAVGVALVFAFAGVREGPISDAGVTLDAELDADLGDAGPGPTPVILPTDAAVEVNSAQDDDAGEEPPPEDAATDAPEDAPGDAIAMSPHDMEEAAKDALHRARALLTDGDIVEARRALELARRYDPEHPDIAQLEALFDAAEEATAPESL